MDAVGQVLLQRTRQQRGRPWGGLAAAVLLHGGVLAAAIYLASWRPPTPSLDYVPVTLMPAQALGVERPRARPHALAPAPAPPKPAAAPPAPPAPPKPAATPKPPPSEPEHPISPEVDRRPVLHNVQEQSLPLPAVKPPKPAKPAKPAPPTPRESGETDEAPKSPAKRAAEPRGASTGPSGPGGVADVGKGDEIGKRGSAAGNPLGTSAFGSSIAGLEDPNFGYGYYIDRLLQLIDANWTRPPVGGEVKTVVYFRIQKTGAITDLRVAQSSGYNTFDLAALRAVQNAAPFPVLPASYHHDSLGVNLIVH